MYKVVFSRRALKDKDKVVASGLADKVKNLVEILAHNPFQNPPRYEKLIGDLNNFYSRRINIKHRLVYAVHEEEKTVVILSMWSHYER